MGAIKAGFHRLRILVGDSYFGNAMRAMLLMRKYDRIHIDFDNHVRKDSIFEGQNTIGKGTSFKGTLGYGSYIGADSDLNDVEIGRFCSIANKVCIIQGKHPKNTFVSTHPAFYAPKDENHTFSYVDKAKFEECSYADEAHKVAVRIDNDCWIGNHVQILAGVKIGDGAIIGAGTIVTKDVPPYSIVVGSPPVIIGKRFSDGQISTLLNIKWWNWPIDEIHQRADAFTDIDSFVKTFGV